MTTIAINDSELYFEDAGDGPAVLFIHGMCGDADVWRDQAARLSDAYRCVRYDRRGHSRSTRGDGQLTSAAHADDAAALIEALGLAPCLLVSSSGGAAIGVDVALRYPHLLRGAVLSEPPLLGLAPAAGEDAMRELAPLIHQVQVTGDTARFVDEFFSLICPGLWSMLDEPARERYRANGAASLEEMLAPRPTITVDQVVNVDIPCLVLAGDQSLGFLQTIAGRLAATLPDSRFTELERCGHVTYAEQPDAFAAAVAAFASEVDRRSGAALPVYVRTTGDVDIAVWEGGHGPPIVLIHGSISDHTTLDPLTDALRRNFTTFALDRRGFGATADGDDYSLDCDADDAAAVIAHVAAQSGAPIVVFGHSYGANVAMAAAARSDSVSHLVLYEPSLGLVTPPTVLAEIERLLAAGDREAAIVALLRGDLGLGDEEVAAFRANALWPTRVAAAHTIPRECRVEGEWLFREGQSDTITARVLMLVGSESPAELVKCSDAAAVAIGGVETRVLEGHGHFAHKSDPRLVAELVRDFVS